VRKGPQGQKRPADLIGNAVRIMRIATGEEEEEISVPKRARKSPRKGRLQRVIVPAHDTVRRWRAAADAEWSPHSSGIPALRRPAI